MHVFFPHRPFTVLLHSPVGPLFIPPRAASRKRSNGDDEDRVEWSSSPLQWCCYDEA